MKRAQASIEYLIILAVVIIIALVVVSLIAGFPELGSGISERESQAYWNIADIGITKYKVNGTGSWGFLRNNRPFSITFQNMTVNGKLNGTAINGLAAGSESGMVNMSGQTCTTGSYSYAVVVYYYDSENNLHRFGGKKDLAGTCQGN